MDEMNDVADLVQIESMRDYALRNLPWRKPRGSIENVIRAYMFPLLLKGMTREHAEITALAKARDQGYDVTKLQLEYKVD